MVILWKLPERISNKNALNTFTTVPDFDGKVDALERPKERAPTGVDLCRVGLHEIADGSDDLILHVDICELETDEVLEWLEEGFVEVEEGMLRGVLEEYLFKDSRFKHGFDSSGLNVPEEMMLRCRGCGVQHFWIWLDLDGMKPKEKEKDGTTIKGSHSSNKDVFRFHFSFELS